MLDTILHYAGIHFLVGLSFSFIVGAKDLYIAFKDDDQDEIHRNLGFMFFILLLWPLIPPVGIYVFTAETFYKQYKKRVTARYDRYHALFMMLFRMEIFNKDKGSYIHVNMKKIRDNKIFKMKKRLGLS